MSKYEVLGVSRSAPLQEIKSAYQAAALATHPDKQAKLATDVLKKQVQLCPSFSKYSNNSSNGASQPSHERAPYQL